MGRNDFRQGGPRRANPFRVRVPTLVLVSVHHLRKQIINIRGHIPTDLLLSYLPVKCRLQFEEIVSRLRTALRRYTRFHVQFPGSQQQHAERHQQQSECWKP